MSRFESVYFAQEHKAVPKVDAITEFGPEGTLEDLARRYHYPGEHETYDELPHGSRDEIYRKDGYILTWNRSLPTVGLVYDTEHEPTEEHAEAMRTKR